MNAGVVPLFQLLALPALAVHLCLAERRRPAPRSPPPPGAGCSPPPSASTGWCRRSWPRRAGEAVAANTERPDAVALTSSWSESIRGLGMWTMYGEGWGRLPTSSFAAYLTNPAVVAATWALPAAAVLGAAVSRARARLAPVLLLAVALPVMVGLHPPASPTPFGRALAWAFAEVPGAIAFRTTNKAGALWALAVAVLAGLGAAAAARRPGWTRVAVAAGGVAVLVGATAPAWTGDLHPTTLTVPGYWRAAAADAGAGDPATRVLFLPGQSLARYRWGHEGVDDLDAVLFDREVVWRPTVPAGSRAAANALAALDVTLNDGGLPPGALSAFARYLGAGEILVRHDTEWERVGAARPAVLDAAVAAEPGLEPAASYGPPGSTTVAPAGGGSLVRPDPAEAALPPLRRVTVADPRPVVRAEPAAGTLLVDGDGFAVPALARARLLDGAPPFRYLGDLDAPGLAAALADGGRIVLTDSNRRRTWDVQQAGRAHSPTLAAEDPLDPATSRTLFLDRDAQTVARGVGGTVSATASGSPFAPTPVGAPALAFDGDPSTAWTFGGFGTADGQSVTLRLPAPALVSRLTLDPTREAGVRIAAVRVTLGGRSVDRPLPGDGAVTLDLPPTRTDTLRVEVTATRGAGQNPVGFREIAVPGARVDTVARLPRTLAVLAAQLDGPGRAALAAAPSTCCSPARRASATTPRRRGAPPGPRDRAARPALVHRVRGGGTRAGPARRGAGPAGRRRRAGARGGLVAAGRRRRPARGGGAGRRPGDRLGAGPRRGRAVARGALPRAAGDRRAPGPARGGRDRRGRDRRGGRAAGAGGPRAGVDGGAAARDPRRPATRHRRAAGGAARRAGAGGAPRRGRPRRPAHRAARPGRAAAVRPGLPRRRGAAVDPPGGHLGRPGGGGAAAVHGLRRARGAGRRAGAAARGGRLADRRPAPARRGRARAPAPCPPWRSTGAPRPR